MTIYKYGFGYRDLSDDHYKNGFDYRDLVDD